MEEKDISLGFAEVPVSPKSLFLLTPHQVFLILLFFWVNLLAQWETHQSFVLKPRVPGMIRAVGRLPVVGNRTACSVCSRSPPPLNSSRLDRLQLHKARPAKLTARGLPSKATSDP